MLLFGTCTGTRISFSALLSGPWPVCTEVKSGTFMYAPQQPGYACFFWGKYFCKCLLFKAGWQTISAGLSWTRCFFKAPPYYDRSLAHTHTHPHTQGKDRPGFCEISSYNFIPFFERGISADTVKTSTWRQDEEQKTMKFNNLEEGRKKCKLVPQSQREGGGTMERTLRCSDVFL